MMGFVSKIIGGRQEPITLCHYIDTLGIGASISFESPCAGYSWASGMVYSSQDASFVFEQGINDLAGALTYRHISPVVFVAATTAESRRFSVNGRFCRLTISNLGAAPASVEGYFVLRGF